MRPVIRIRTWLALTLATLPAAWGEDWIRFRSGPFEVLTNAGERPGREQAYDAEQFRYALGNLLGKQDLGSTFPIRIVVLREKEASPYSVPGSLLMSRDAWISVAAGDRDLGTEWRKTCARILLDANSGRMPAGIERGLISFISTLEVNGTRLTWGAPPPVAERTRDWAVIEFLATNAEYAGRIRVFMSNLQNGADYDGAYRNAFEKSAAEMNKQIDAYFKAGKFDPAPFSGRALSARDFTARTAEAYDGRLALADLLFTNPARASEAEAAYKALTGAEAQEGLGFLALRGGRKDVKSYFEAAGKADSKNPRAWAEVGTREALLKAVELNPKWAEPHVRLAALETDPGRKATELKRAATVEPRSAALWKAFALAAAEANQFGEAGKAWSAAEKASATPEEREQIHQARLDLERQKADFDAAERQRLADEQAREMQRLKDQAMSEIHAAEDKARKEMNANRGPAPTKVEQWSEVTDGPSKQVSGTLDRIECIGRQARVWITDSDSRKVQLLVPDPGKITLSGTGEFSFTCGIQNPARKVSVDYTAAPNAKMKTIGNVQLIDFK